MSGTPRARFRARRRAIRRVGRGGRTTRSFVRRAIRSANETKCKIVTYGPYYIPDSAIPAQSWIELMTPIAIGAQNDQRIGNKLFALNLQLVGNVVANPTIADRLAAFVRLMVIYSPVQLPAGAMPKTTAPLDLTTYPTCMTLLDEQWFITVPDSAVAPPLNGTASGLSGYSAVAGTRTGPAWNIKRLISLHKNVEYSGVAVTKGYVYLGLISNIPAAVPNQCPVFNIGARVLFKDP